MSAEYTIQAMIRERDKAKAQVKALDAAIRAMGGGAIVVPPAKPKGWPKGKPRGPRKPEVATASPIAQARAKRATTKTAAAPAASLAAAAS